MTEIQACFLGTIRYEKAWQMQQAIHELCCHNKIRPTLLLLEHNPVITLGNRGLETSVLVSQDYLEQEGIDFCRSNRGGDVTCHMPGQLVIYPILSLKDFGLGVKDYVCLLEKSIMEFLANYGVKAEIISGQPGVWVAGNKIASVGIRVKGHVTLHGLALNLKNSLDLFQKVVPCGIKGCQMTSLAELTSQDLTLSQAAWQLTEILARRLGAVLQKIEPEAFDKLISYSSSGSDSYDQHQRNHERSQPRTTAGASL